MSDEGFYNRYRWGEAKHPHMERAYDVIYSGNDNSDYTCDENRNNRRLNKAVSARKAVNGHFDMKVHLEMAPSSLEH